MMRIFPSVAAIALSSVCGFLNGLFSHDFGWAATVVTVALFFLGLVVLDRVFARVHRVRTPLAGKGQQEGRVAPPNLSDESFTPVFVPERRILAFEHEGRRYLVHVDKQVYDAAVVDEPIDVMFARGCYTGWNRVLYVKGPAAR